MRRVIGIGLAAALAAGCLEGARAGRERDDRLEQEIAQQQRWAAQAVSTPPEDAQLAAAREGDDAAVRELRKKYKKLVSAIGRAAWVREALPDALRDMGDDAAAVDPAVRDFERAGELRTQAMQGADEIALALADSQAQGALSLNELKSGLLAVRRAQESEQRLAKELGAGIGKKAAPGPDGGNAKADPLERLSTVPMPTPRPFIEAAARFFLGHGGQDPGALGSELREEQAQIRAALAELENEDAGSHIAGGGAMTSSEAAARASEGGGSGGGDANGSAKTNANENGTANATGGGTAGAKAGAPPADGGPERRLTVAADAKKLLARRGPPASISLRADGTFGLRYEEKRPCGIDSCRSQVDYLFDAQGKLLRSEVISQEKR